MKSLRSQHKTAHGARKASRQETVFCPGALFFTHVIEWPEGVEAQELAALAELTLEDVSPFALESLAWGFVADAASRSLLLYAVCLPRISHAEQEKWQQARYVLPAFIPLVVARAGNLSAAASGSAPAADPAASQLPVFELLLNDTEVLLLERDPATGWLRRVRAEALEPATADTATADSPAAVEPGSVAAAGVPFAAVRAAAARLLTAAGVPVAADGTLPSSVPFYRLQSATEEKRGLLRFALSHVEEEPKAGSAGRQTTSVEVAPLLLTALENEEACWRADLRPASFAEQLRKRRGNDVRLWQLLCAAVGGAVVLLLLWLLYWGLGFSLTQRTATIAAQKSAVERIRQDQDLLTRMRQFSAEPFAPFGLIDALKDGKPDPIFFDVIELSGPDSVTVEGQGPTVDSVNSYVRSLEQAGRFLAARQARMNLKDGVSVFTLYLQYLGAGQGGVLPSAADPAAVHPAAQSGSPVRSNGAGGAASGSAVTNSAAQAVVTPAASASLGTVQAPAPRASLPQQGVPSAASSAQPESVPAAVDFDALPDPDAPPPPWGEGAPPGGANEVFEIDDLLPPPPPPAEQAQ